MIDLRQNRKGPNEWLLKWWPTLVVIGLLSIVGIIIIWLGSQI